MGTPTRSPTSTTDPTQASDPMGRQASRSCNIEDLCSPTFSAAPFAVRWKSETQFMRNGFDFLHDISNHRRDVGVTKHLTQSSPRQRTHTLPRIFTPPHSELF